MGVDFKDALKWFVERPIEGFGITGGAFLLWWLIEAVLLDKGLPMWFAKGIGVFAYLVLVGVLANFWVKTVEIKNKGLFNKPSMKNL